MNRMTHLLVTTLAAVTVGATVPAVASAAAPPSEAQVLAAAAPDVEPAGLSSCPSSYVCFWVHINYAPDPPGKLSGNNRSWFVFPRAACANGTWADCASSIANRGVNCTVHLYYLENYGLPRLDLARGDEIPDLTRKPTGLGNSWNDNIRSNNWC